MIIEDDQTIADFVARGLRESGFAVDHAPDGETGLEAALQQTHDVAIVDLMLPKRDGLSVIDELRRRGKSTPVLILSARRSVDDRVRGLQTGGDDYLTSLSPSPSSWPVSRHWFVARRARLSQQHWWLAT